MVAAPLPHFDGRSDFPSRGVCCKAGQIMNVDPMIHLRLIRHPYDPSIFSDEVVLEHFQWCAKAQELWQEALESMAKGQSVSCLVRENEITSGSN